MQTTKTQSSFALTLLGNGHRAQAWLVEPVVKSHSRLFERLCLRAYSSSLASRLSQERCRCLIQPSVRPSKIESPRHTFGSETASVDILHFQLSSLSFTSILHRHPHTKASSTSFDTQHSLAFFAPAFAIAPTSLHLRSLPWIGQDRKTPIPPSNNIFQLFDALATKALGTCRCRRRPFFRLQHVFLCCSFDFIGAHNHIIIRRSSTA